MTGQCSLLYINTPRFADTQSAALRSLGFDVEEIDDVPPREGLVKYHAIILRTKPTCSLPNVATCLRAAPLFGRRVLVALVPACVPPRARRDAIDSGFDVVLPEETSARDLAAAILGLLRKFPEHRCVLRSFHHNRRRAA